MSDKHPEPIPSDSGKGFLGGDFQFNKVGASGASPAASDTEPVVIIPHSTAKALLTRRVVIIVLLFVLGLVLYLFSNDSLGGVEHRTGHGGVSPSTHTPDVPQNF